MILEFANLKTPSSPFAYGTKLCRLKKSLVLLPLCPSEAQAQSVQRIASSLLIFDFCTTPFGKSMYLNAAVKILESHGNQKGAGKVIQALKSRQDFYNYINASKATKGERALAEHFEAVRYDDWAALDTSRHLVGIRDRAVKSAKEAVKKAATAMETAIETAKSADPKNVKFDVWNVLCAAREAVKKAAAALNIAAKNVSTAAAAEAEVLNKLLEISLTAIGSNDTQLAAAKSAAAAAVSAAKSAADASSYLQNAASGVLK